MVDVSIDQVPLSMEVDTGASCSIISQEVFENMWPDRSARPRLKESSRRLLTYMRDEVPLAGVANVSVTYGDQSAQLPLLVVKQPGPALLGRDWLKAIRLDWPSLFLLSSGGPDPLPSSAHSLSDSLKQLVSEFPEVFSPGLGRYKPRKVSLQVDESAPPRFYKHRPPPLALKKDIEDELDRQVQLGILRPVPTSEWAAPVVPIKKSTGAIRLCGSYDLTVNTATSLESYPLPRIEELFAELAGGQFYTKIDLREAYLQLELEDSSQRYTTINTHKGLFQVTRLAYGIKSAVAIFQREMETLLAGVPHTAVFLDDLCITGSSPAEHLKNVKEVLKRLSEAGLKVNVKKTTWLATEVQYLGHKISAAGIQPADEKVRAVREAPEPENLQQLRAYLGLLQYYSRFLPRLSVVASPLYQLEKKDVKWEWGPEQSSSFKATKDLLCSAPILQHYQPSLPLVLTTDASPDGVAAVLSHPEGVSGPDRPIAFASRRLSPAERNYSQLDREALAVMFGVAKFHQYVYGRCFTIKTDHKPLLGLLSLGKALPQVVSARMLRWKLTLTGYEFVLKYIPGRDIANADGLSRLPLPTCPESTPLPADVVQMMDAVGSLVSVPLIQTATRRDPVISAAYIYTRDGWPAKCPKDDLSVLFSHRSELSIDNGCLLWGLRVVIPHVLRSRVLSMLHDGHPGMTAMKQLARGVVWWPGLDGHIEDCVRACQVCQSERGKVPDVPLSPWIFPNEPWKRIHVDFAGPVEGKMLLVIVDAYSKWLDVYITSSTSSECVMDKLRQSFAVFGLPTVLVSDNATCFTSESFKNFLKVNDVKHVYSPPRHPASNGQAEASVKIVKNALKRRREGSLQTRLSRFLLSYRASPQSTTGRAPAELMLGRSVRTRLRDLRPSLRSAVEARQDAMKDAHDRRAQSRTFSPGDSVLVSESHNFGARWVPADVLSVAGQSCEVRLSDGRVFTRHRDHLRHDPSAVGGAGLSGGAPVLLPSRGTLPFPSDDAPVLPPSVEKCQPAPPVPTAVVSDECERSPVSSASDRPAAASPVGLSSPVLRRSQRVRRKPDRLVLN